MRVTTAVIPAAGLGTRVEIVEELARELGEQRRARGVPADAHAAGDGVGADVANAGFAPQRVVDQPGAGGAVHAFADHGDLAALGRVEGVSGLHVGAVPGAVVGGRQVHAGAGGITQAVVVAQAGVADPAGGRPAAGAADFALGAVQAHAHGVRGQGLAAVEAARRCRGIHGAASAGASVTSVSPGW